MTEFFFFFLNFVCVMLLEKALPRFEIDWRGKARVRMGVSTVSLLGVVSLIFQRYTVPWACGKLAFVA